MAKTFGTEGEVFVIRLGEGSGRLASVKQTINISRKDLRSLLGQGSGPLPAKRKKGWLVSFLLRLRQAFPFVLLTDDGGFIYRRRAFLQACKLIEHEEITTLFSSFRPWADHLVARRLQRRYPQLRWIADFRDLPVDPVRKDIWWPSLQTRWGRWLVKPATEVWVVSEGQREQLLSWHPRIRVQRNALLRLPPSESAPRTKCFTIVYTGSLYPELQTIRPLVKALERLIGEGLVKERDILLQYRGKDVASFAVQASGLPAPCLDVQPTIAPAAAQEMQKKAQLLLLLNWSAPGYYGVLTAKLWDYLATGRPILALCNGPKDPELQHIVEGAAAGAVFADEEHDQLEDWLRQAYETWQKGGSLPWSVDTEVLRTYLPPANK
ncbi:MAG: hypothetical protein AAGF89_07985 [Bacteroidota bacterium]